MTHALSYRSVAAVVSCYWFIVLGLGHCFCCLFYPSLAEHSISSTHSTDIDHDTSFVFHHESDICTVDGSPGFGRNHLQLTNATELLPRQRKVRFSSKMQNISNLSMCLPSSHSLGGCCRLVARIWNWIQRILRRRKSSVKFYAVFPGLQLNGDFDHLFWPTLSAWKLRVTLQTQGFSSVVTWFDWLCDHLVVPLFFSRPLAAYFPNDPIAGSACCERSVCCSPVCLGLEEYHSRPSRGWPAGTTNGKVFFAVESSPGIPQTGAFHIFITCVFISNLKLVTSFGRKCRGPEECSLFSHHQVCCWNRSTSNVLWLDWIEQARRKWVENCIHLV